MEKKMKYESDCMCMCLQVNLCVLQASVEEGSPSNKCVTHVSLVALCFDRIATQLRMNR